MRTSIRGWAGGVLVTVALTTFGLVRPADGSLPFFLLLALASTGYLATLSQLVKGLRPSGRTLVLCAAVALVWRVPMVLAPPEPAADLRRYLWDAHLVRAGLSPYDVVPADPAVAGLRTAENWPVNNPEVPSPYPPAAQLFFLLATAMSETARAIKVTALVCDAFLALVVWRSLLATGGNPGWVLAYLFSPLVSLEIARHGHLDVAGALLLAVAALALVRGRALLGSVALALSIAVKPLPIVLLPLLWRRISLRHVGAGLVVLAALYVPFRSGRGLPIGSVPDVIARFRFNGPVFSTAAALAGPKAATLLAIAAGLAIAVRARRRHALGSPTAWAWPMAATLVAAPLVYPWYLVWLAPFLVALGTMPLALWTVSILGTYVVWARVDGAWEVPVWALLVEYGALVAGALWLWRRGRSSNAPRSVLPSESS